MENETNVSNPCEVECEMLATLAKALGAGEHIKAICRMAMNTMNSPDAKLNSQTLYSAFAMIEMILDGKNDELFTMAEVYPGTNAEDFEDFE